jgi:DNA end-binding protein Ku
MAQAIWTGTLSFGLVSIPVKLYGATSPRDVRFHQFEGRSGRRVRYRRVANETDTPLWEGIPQPEQPNWGAVPDWPRDQRSLLDSPGTPPEEEAESGDDAIPAPAPEPEMGLEPARPEPSREATFEDDDEREPRDVAFEDVVRGFEVDPGRFIRVTDEDLERFAPEQDRTIQIEDFVRLDEIDPVHFEKSYFVVPARGGEKTYGLLVRAMEEAGYVAIGRFVLRTREHVAAIRPTGGALMLETLFRADEVRDPADLGLGPAEEPSERELEIAVRLIEALATDWDPARYPDDYRERVLEMIRSKAGPAPDVVPTPYGEEKEPAVFDLMEALKKSVEDARRARESEPAASSEAKNESSRPRRKSG